MTATESSQGRNRLPGASLGLNAEQCRCGHLGAQHDDPWGRCPCGCPEYRADGTDYPLGLVVTS